MNRRLHYLIGAAITMVIGLGSRAYAERLPEFVAAYAGDTLWALMVFFAVSFLLPSARLSHRAGIAILFAYAIELSQLYKSPWIQSIRQTTLGGLVLGFGFLWTDLICYAIGVSIGALLDYLVFGRTRANAKQH